MALEQLGAHRARARHRGRGDARDDVRDPCDGALSGHGARERDAPPGLEAMKAGIVELGCGVRIAYDEGGAGKPVLLINGLTESRAAWDEVTPSLARDHRV